MARWWLLLLACALSCAAEVTVKQEGGNYLAKSTGYQATVAGTDGCLTNLTVAGQSFFLTNGGFPRGIYLYQDKLLPLPTVTQPAANTVLASGPLASARYEFGDAVALTVTNTSEKPVLIIIVLEEGVTAVGDTHGKFARPPVNKQWPRTVWYREQSKLTITGGTRIWGPWNGKLQVWQGDVPPKETRKVTFEPAAATAQEAADAARLAAFVPPPPAEPTGPMWDLAALSAAPATQPAEGFTSASPNIRALFYDSVPYHGQPTRVFAWLGLPKVEPGQRVPGIVLVHGGGGTAFENWVKLWNDRGYAAISMDTCGCVPRGKYGAWQRHEQGGPHGWGGWDQIDEPREDQWTYHAVAAAVLADSLLRAQPGVDPERIGLTGISWGGYLASILAGVDSRLKFVAPVYGCGFTRDHNFAPSVNGLGQVGGDRWMRWWDPSAYLAQARMPMLWVTGTNDFAYTFPALQKSYRLAAGPRTLAIRLRMPHGHGPAGEAPKEIQVFADALLNGGAPLAKVTGQGRDGRNVWATFEAKAPVVKAELCYTLASGPWMQRRWETAPATIAGGKVTAVLPEGVTVWYLNLFDDRMVVSSSEHEELGGK